MTYADPQYVLDRYEGTAPTARIQTYLDDAELLLIRRIPDLAARVTAGTLDVELVRLVEAQAVIRHLRNPQGFTSESDGDYSYSRGKSASGGGRIWFLAEEIGLLLPSATPADAWGTVRVGLPQDRQGAYPR